MKTSELIKRLNELDCGFGISKDENGGITLKIWNGNEIMRVTKSNVDLFKTWFELGSPLDKGIKLMFEYANTPLEEREEEKKYYLNTHNSFNNLNRHLVYSAIYNGFVLLGVNDESNSYIKSRFTQKEIDAMPFDTNFFIKEEVDEN